VKLIAAGHLSAPLVVVAHSYGGLIAGLLARTHPALVSGLVFVDPTSEFLPRLGRPDQDADFDRSARAPTPDPDGEGFLAYDAFGRFRTAPLLPKVPAVVLSCDRFIVAGSGHNIML
jgi:pimeloyl-ACP methyl ester carboxylesterase